MGDQTCVDSVDHIKTMDMNCVEISDDVKYNIRRYFSAWTK